MNELNNKILELLSPIFAYGIDWEEFKDKSEHDHSVSTFAGKIKQEHKEKLAAQLEALITDQVRLGRIDELELAEAYDKAQKGIYSGEVYRRNRIKELKSE